MAASGKYEDAGERSVSSDGTILSNGGEEREAPAAPRPTPDVISKKAQKVVPLPVRQDENALRKCIECMLEMHDNGVPEDEWPYIIDVLHKQGQFGPTKTEANAKKTEKSAGGPARAPPTSQLQDRTSRDRSRSPSSSKTSSYRIRSPAAKDSAANVTDAPILPGHVRGKISS